MEHNIYWDMVEAQKKHEHCPGMAHILDSHGRGQLSPACLEPAGSAGCAVSGVT